MPRISLFVADRPRIAGKINSRAGGAAALLFGYDLFISFALGKPPRGTRAYASDLARKLRERGFTVFFSEDEAAAGNQLDGTLTRALHRSKVLVVIANSGMLADPRWVRKEVEEFRLRHPKRLIVPVNVNAALQDQELLSVTEQWLQFQNKIWIDEVHGADTSGIASDEVVERLATAPRSVRSAIRLNIALIGTALVLMAIAAFAFWQRDQALQNLEQADKNAAEARSEKTIAQKNADSANKQATRAEIAEQDAVAKRDLALAAAKREAEARAGEEAQRRTAEGNLVEARRQERAAVAARALAESRELAARSSTRLERDDATAALVLAIAAANRAASMEARHALVAAMDASYSRARLPHDPSLHTAAFVQEDRLIVTAGQQSIRLWDSQTASLEREVKVRNLRGLAISQDGQTLLTAEEGRARLLKTSNGDEIRIFPDKTGSQIAFAAFSPDEQMVVTTSGASAHLWRVDSDKPVARLWGHHGSVLHAAFSPDGRQLATAGGESNSAFLWDVDAVVVAGEVTPAKSLGGVDTNGKVVTVAFSPDGQWLITASHRAGARAWRVSGIKKSSRLEPVVLHEGDVVPIVFARSNAEIATGGLNGLVRVHKINHDRFEFQATLTASRLPLDVLNQALSAREETNLTSALAFDRTGTRLVTGSGSGAVKVWSMETTNFGAAPPRWRMALHLRGSRDWVRTAVFSADGTLALTAGKDGIAQIWDALPRRPVANGNEIQITDLVKQAELRLPVNLSADDRLAMFVKE